MKHSSLIIDLAASTGGNTEVTVSDKIVEMNGVKVIGYSNLAASIPFESSKLYAKNLYNFVKYAVQSGKLNTADDLVKPMLLTHEGKVLYGL